MNELRLDELADESPVCMLALHRAENWERESRLLGAILVALVAVVALALAVAVGLAVAGLPTAAIITALGGIVDGAAAVFVVRRRSAADTRHEDAINDAKRVCGAATVRHLG